MFPERDVRSDRHTSECVLLGEKQGREGIGVVRGAFTIADRVQTRRQTTTKEFIRGMFPKDTLLP